MRLEFTEHEIVRFRHVSGGRRAVLCRIVFPELPEPWATVVLDEVGSSVGTRYFRSEGAALTDLETRS